MFALLDNLGRYMINPGDFIVFEFIYGSFDFSYSKVIVDDPRL